MSSFSSWAEEIEALHSIALISRRKRKRKAKRASRTEKSPGLSTLVGSGVWCGGGCGGGGPVLGVGQMRRQLDEKERNKERNGETDFRLKERHTSSPYYPLALSFDLDAQGEPRWRAVIDTRTDDGPKEGAGRLEMN